MKYGWNFQNLGEQWNRWQTVRNIARRQPHRCFFQIRFLGFWNIIVLRSDRTKSNKVSLIFTVFSAIWIRCVIKSVPEMTRFACAAAMMYEIVRHVSRLYRHGWKNKSPQNRYCCVPLCNKKGSTGRMVKKLDFEDLQRKLSETQKLLKETKESKLKLEAEVEKLRLPQCLFSLRLSRFCIFSFKKLCRL